MEKIIVRGGNRLEGTVKVEGAKNAVLPILAATLLASEGQSVLTNVPILSDVFTMNNVLKHLNVGVEFQEKNNTILADASNDINFEAPFAYVSKMRASIVVMGPLLARLGHARIALPGGCAIGTRPIDLHLKGFEAMGADIKIENGFVEAKVDRLVGARIYLDFPSVGATQNIMMGATLAEGTTIIENVAREPEIVDLANFLNRMGAKVVGAGTETIRIEGVSSMKATEHSIIPDRIEAGTFMIAAAVTNGNVFIEDAIADHNKPLISKLKEMHVAFQEEENGLRVIGPRSLKATDVKTMPHPGFPTDMQAQMTIAQLVSQGTSTMTETVFENRFMHLEEMRRMNADFKVEGQTVLIHGNTDLQGAEVAASDLRAAAALIIAGLVSKGYTRVTNLSHLDRGYYEFDKKLQALGADVERVTEDEKNVFSDAEVEALFVK
ncbi:MAG: UDP-N-acetylglucosamine 1-carboxyvinyltransferase [Trichococcus flocculiformis]|jgi:UDP-N-acetylglucosamine 1-carboxyvinyltransferase|uniref:UDP-N-acetylglucosamine 1-carboxyvinyltransferase n=4 Tax=root TaxID=1 RepID=A0AB38BFY4_9LACT|nr:UDP-N-acetylglucosamine 1-carboxyvinyltransferase [Trichococcus flocculiformis]MBP6164676.1 UDP-N-acetylglucosamine 1-carboxyvinyltransferase [Trichococcus sp.]NCB64638.1 UDP-N-acetylglucosamine 1-carboxyvinyltransferase [Bacilli bacterium]MBP6246746.1 UDP-N-acetylglucosamine 1-carboxyvinyltransferase [Trichococcus sp.]MBP7128118.1 UDP-N-acetylglucosamine 1-carboxyvinyltransferase [Trichococcus sp.]MBP8682769.1 UDP-N-acetylglucosamine 1-carboxyvinyltransferase [Trichococcus sp.]